MNYKVLHCLLFSFLLMQFTWAQDITITGTITDELDQPLPGVNIIEAGTSNGVVSDFDGNYSITVQTDASLNFSYIGYIGQTIKIGVATEIDLQLQPDLQTLDEVVVVGYSAEKKENIVSAVTTVEGEDLLETGITNISQIIQDRLPGVITELGSGQPGADDVNIVIRGASSFKDGANSPLVLIDGIETASGFSQIDPGEIASFSVLKDAASTAVYGVRGANGVILITTKRGRIGAPQISVDFGVTAKTVSSTPDQLGSLAVLELGNEAIRNTGRYDLYNNQSYINEFRYGDRDFIRYPDVDWYDVLIKDVGWESNARVNVSGGTEAVQYFSSFSVNRVGDILNNADFNGYYDPEFSFNRYNFRTNLDFKITNTTKLAVNIGGRSELTRSPESEFSGDGTSDQIFLFIDQATPYFFPVIYPEEFVRQNPDPFAPNDFGPRVISTLRKDPFQKNPWTLLNYTGLRRERNDVLDINVVATQNLDMITPGLTLSGKYSLSSQYRFRKSERWTNDQWFYNVETEEWEPQRQDQNYGTSSLGFKSGGGENFRDSFRNLYYEVKLNYQKYFGKHNVNYTGVFNRTQRNSNVSEVPSLSEDWVSAISYNYDERYILNLNGAYNGSEKFARGKRFGFFPAVAVGWNIAKEPFIKNNIEWMDNLKVRYSYGITGSDQNSPRFLFQGGYSPVDSRFANVRFGLPAGGLSTRYGELRIPNLDAEWETSVKNNLGFDIGLFNNDLTLEVDFFDEERTGILVSLAQPSFFNPSFGNPAVGGRTQFPQVNVGATKKQGYEIVGNYSHQTPQGFTYGLGGYLAYIESRITNRPDIDRAGTPEYQRLEGKPLGGIFALNTNGYYNSFEEAINAPEVSGGNAPGRYVYSDFNGDGEINNQDRAIQNETSQPAYTFGFNTNVSYKNFDFSARFLGKSGISYVATRYYPNFNQYLFEAKEYHLDRWSPENTDARFPAYTNIASQQFYEQPTNRNVQNSSYLKLQTVTLGYNMRSDYLKQLLRIESLRFNLSGQNLYSWSKLPGGGDPEGGNAVRGTGVYPLIRRFIFTLSVNF